MADRGMAGESAEMYLKSLCELGGDVALVPIADLARRLGISPISATERVHRLEGQGWVEHTPYRGVQLTRRGVQQARRILRRHRLWERFLVDHLGMAWDQVHDLACQLEHAVDDPVTERLAAFLDEPASCPHGNHVPAADGSMDAGQGSPLHELPPGQTARVVRIRAESNALLSAVKEAGLVPGVTFQRSAASSSDEALRLELPWGTVEVDLEMAAHIMVEAGG